MVKKNGPLPAYFFNPPLVPPMIPNLGIPSLVGFLQHRNIPVRQTDFNILFHYDILEDKAFLSAISNYYRERFDLLDRRPFLEYRESQEYISLFSQVCRMQVLIENQSRIAALCRASSPHLEPLPFGYPSQKYAFELTDLVLSMFGVGRMRYGESVSLIFDEIVGEHAEIIETFYDKHISHMNIQGASIFGISMLYESQVRFALLLVKYLRRRFPGILIAVGGPLTSRFPELQHKVDLHRIFDIIVLGEGENAIIDYLQGWPIMAESYGESKIIKNQTPVFPLPVPSFNAEELPLYWGAPLTLPVQMSRGCYWGRCGFCRYAELYNSGYRVMTPQAAVNTLFRLQTDYGCSSFDILDDCMSPAFLEKFADLIIKTSLAVKWSASVRFESDFTPGLLNKIATAGCHRLTFGMETVSQRLLDFIEKGTRKETYLPILEACKNAGIKVHLNWIAGLPTESPAELEETVRFLSENTGLYSYQFGHVFTLEPHSPFSLKPGHFNLTAPDPDKPFYSEEKKKRLMDIIHSISPSMVTHSNPYANDPAITLPSPKTKVRINYDISEIFKTVMEQKGQVMRLKEECILLYDFSENDIFQVSAKTNDHSPGGEHE